MPRLFLVGPLYVDIYMAIFYILSTSLGVMLRMLLLVTKTSLLVGKRSHTLILYGSFVGASCIRLAFFFHMVIFVLAYTFVHV